jgi:hypothetical protein
LAPPAQIDLDRARTTRSHHPPRVTRNPQPRAVTPPPGICNPYRIEFCLGPVTRGSHVPWQPRARICKSFRLVPDPPVFHCVGPNCGSIVGSPTTSPHPSHATGLTPYAPRSATHHPPVFVCAGPNFGSLLVSTTDSRQRPHGLRSTVHGPRPTIGDVTNPPTSRLGMWADVYCWGEPLGRGFPAGNRERFRLAGSVLGWCGGSPPDSPNRE